MQKKLNHLGLFAKFWEPGKVKTRLANSVGNQNASSVYFAMVMNLLHKLDLCGDQRTIAFAPIEKENEFSSLVEQRGLNWNIEPQSAGGLGQRMTSFFKSKLDSTPTSVVLIGSDCLEIDADTLDRAFAMLNDSDVVLGPSFDGGYYLVGMSTYRPEIFQDIEWSTESVFEQSIQRMKTHDISYSILEQKHDIDHLEDLVRLKEQLVSGPGEDESNSVVKQLNDKLREAIQTALTDL